MSVPSDPSIIFVPELPLKTLFRLLPVAFISEAPIKLISSTFAGRV